MLNTYFKYYTIDYYKLLHNSIASQEGGRERDLRRAALSFKVFHWCHCAQYQKYLCNDFSQNAPLRHRAKPVCELVLEDCSDFYCELSTRKRNDAVRKRMKMKKTPKYRDSVRLERERRLIPLLLLFTHSLFLLRKRLSRHSAKIGSVSVSVCVQFFRNLMNT